MGNVDGFFDREIKEIESSSQKAVRGAAFDLRADLLKQIRRKFKNPSAAFLKGVKIHDFENASYVRLSPILSSHAEKTKISGNPNLWILLPDGLRLGFKRMGHGFSWSDLKYRYKNRLSFVSVNSGMVVLFRSKSGVYPVYKIQKQVESEQRLDFYDTAERIGKDNNLEVLKNGDW